MEFRKISDLGVLFGWYKLDSQYYDVDFCTFADTKQKKLLGVIQQ